MAAPVKSVPDPFFRKLRHFINLSSDEEFQLSKVLGQSQVLDAHEELAKQGTISKEIHLIIGGMAYRYTALPNNQFAISGLLLPGDLSCPTMELDRLMDHSIFTISRCRYIRLTRTTVDQMVSVAPQMVKALWRLSLADQSIARGWCVNIGQRSSSRSMAHTFCEILVRLQSVGLADDNEYELPFTQAAIGEMLGISAVHVNRVLQDLRSAKLIVFSKNRLQILNVERLKAFSRFNSDYLQMRWAN